MCAHVFWLACERIFEADHDWLVLCARDQVGATGGNKTRKIML